MDHLVWRGSKWKPFRLATEWDFLRPELYPGPLNLGVEKVSKFSAKRFVIGEKRLILRQRINLLVDWPSVILPAPAFVKISQLTAREWREFEGTSNGLITISVTIRWSLVHMLSTNNLVDRSKTLFKVTTTISDIKSMFYLSIFAVVNFCKKRFCFKRFLCER